MTIITLNLLAEEQIAEQTEARDPVKGAVAIGAILILLCASVGVWASTQASRNKVTANLIQHRLDSLATPATGTNADAKAALTLGEDVVVINRARILFAPRLALIKNLVPETVQLTRANLNINTELIASPAPTAVKESDSGESAAGAGPAAKPARGVAVPRSIDRLVLQLDGKAVSSRPEIEVDNFIKSLRENPDLKDQVKQIQLRSITRLADGADGTSAQPAVTFVIECQFKEQP